MRSNKSNEKSQVDIIDYLSNSIFKSLWYEYSSPCILDETMGNITSTVSVAVFLEIDRAMDMTTDGPSMAMIFNFNSI